MKKSFRALGLFVAIAALGLVACGEDAAPAAAPAAKAAPTVGPTSTPVVIIEKGDDTVVVATPIPTTAPTPIPAKSREPRGTLRVVDNVGCECFHLRFNPGFYNRLISDPMVGWDWAKDGPTTEAILSKWAYEENTDGSVDWVWTIKPNVQFAKGWGTLTSTDVKATFLAHLRPGTVNGNRKYFARWYGSDAKNLDDSDPLVLKIHQPEKANFVEQFRVLSFEEGRTLRPFPKAYEDKVGDKEFDINPVYAGAYELTSQQRGYDMVLTAVEDHYRVVPGFKTIQFFKVLDTATKIAMLRTGQIDIGTVPGKLAKDVQSAGVKLMVSKNSVEPFINFGGLYPSNPNYDPNFPWTTATPLEGKAVQVRKALNYAIDRKAIVEKILFGFGEPIYIGFSFLSPTANDGGPPPWWNDAWKPYPYDPALAREILAKAGYPNCFEWNQWHITGQIYGPDIGEAVASNWEKELGCKINRRTGEYRPGLRGMLINQKTDGWTYLFEGSPIARPQRYACLHGGPTYQVIMHSTLSFFTELCSKSDKMLDPAKVVEIERQIGDWEYKTFNVAAVVSVHQVYGVGPNVKSYTPMPKKNNLGNLEFAMPA